MGVYLNGIVYHDAAGHEPSANKLLLFYNCRNYDGGLFYTLGKTKTTGTGR